MTIESEGAKMFARIHEALAELDLDKPRVTRIKACPLAIEAIKAVSITHPAPQVGHVHMLGVPLILDENFPAGTWRAFDQHGEVMSEGNVFPSVDPLDILPGSSKLSSSEAELGYGSTPR